MSKGNAWTGKLAPSNIVWGVGIFLLGCIGSAIFTKSFDFISASSLSIATAGTQAMVDSFYSRVPSTKAEGMLHGLLAIVLGLLFALSRRTFIILNFVRNPEDKVIKKDILGKACVITLFISGSILYTSYQAELRVYDHTKLQLSIIEPYTKNSDLLNSQFLLVQNKSDYVELWESIYAIAKENDVVHPRFLSVKP